MSDCFAKYEKYETKKLRPLVLPQKSVKANELTICSFSMQTEKLDTKGTTLLYPKLAGKPVSEAIEIFKKASLYKKQIAGVVLNLASFTTEEYEALCNYIKTLFSHSQLVCDIYDERLIQDKFSRKFGVLLSGTAQDIRQNLATFKLYNRHETAPIYFNDNQISEQDKETLCHSWHVYRSTGTAVCGACISFRRIAYPKNLCTGGAFPIRMWLQNVGISAEYLPLKIRLAVKTENGLLPIKLKHKCGIFKSGDLTYNEITALPVLAQGDYKLMCALFAGKKAITLANDEKCENGYYSFGTITIGKSDCNLLYNAWEDYYPEGYYPLEDPKLPY